MHPDLVAISNLYAADRVIDGLRAEHEGLSGAVRAARAALEAAEARVAGAQEALAAVVAQQRKTERELGGYVDQRDRTRKLIDTGGVAEYAAAERQVAQCNAIIDDLETRSLEEMERRDGAEAELSAAKAEVAEATARLAEARAALGARDGAIRAELASAVEAQRTVAAELPAAWRVPYAELRRRKRAVLVNVVDGNCSACGMRVTPQKVLETQKLRAVHTCVGCSGFILP